MSEIRALSPRARATVDRLGALAEWLSRHPAQSSDTVTRPHPLLLLVRRAGFSVLIAPASALDILGFEVKDNHVDGELVRIFTEAKIWESVVSAPVSAR